MNKEEYKEIQIVLNILNKYRNIWYSCDYPHKEISQCIDDFLPNFYIKIEQLIKLNMLDKLEGENNE